MQATFTVYGPLGAGTGKAIVAVATPAEPESVPVALPLTPEMDAVTVPVGVAVPVDGVTVAEMVALVPYCALDGEMVAVTVAAAGEIVTTVFTVLLDAEKLVSPP